jgi:hypothetical protein
MAMRKTVLLFASMALAVLLGTAVTGSEPVVAQQSLAPNFVFILADDMRKDDVIYMPKTQTLLGAKGMQFENAFVSYGLCCPSRATILTGQYAHNNGVWTNGNPPNTTDGCGRASRPAATRRTTWRCALTTPATAQGSWAST